jgi:CDP-diacylglycerol---glycerol-3-phosphate 3-phosphatidyltransferase
VYPQLNIATSLTWFRVAAVPLLAVLFFYPATWARPVTAIVFALAAITDLLDGYVARRLGQVSQFGAFLDPVADKIMVAVVLVLLVHADKSWIVALLGAIIIGREITVSALREWMAELGARHRVAVSSLGKLKTTLQMTGLGLMLFEESLLGLPIYDAGLGLLIVAAGLTIWSMVGYMRAAWPGRDGVS